MTPIHDDFGSFSPIEFDPTDLTLSVVEGLAVMTTIDGIRDQGCTILFRRTSPHQPPGTWEVVFQNPEGVFNV
jgi:hypothetical protein